MSQLTRDRLLAALGVPRASRDELGELSYEGRADLLGCKTRLTAVVEAGRVAARCEMQTSDNASWATAWQWDILSSPDGRMRLAHSERPCASATRSASDSQAAGSIEEAKALARAAIVQIRTNPQWSKSGLVCGPAADMSSFAALAHEKSESLASLDPIAAAPARLHPRKVAVFAPNPVSMGQAALFADEPAPSHAFKR